MRRLVAEAGIADRVRIDSAGISDWHAGSAPDLRAAAAAAARGTVLDGQARQVRPKDFSDSDLLLCADRANAATLLALAPDAEAAERVRLLREFDPASVAAGQLDVPDPYLGEDGFAQVLDIIEASCAGLLVRVERAVAAPARPRHRGARG